MAEDKKPLNCNQLLVISMQSKYLKVQSPLLEHSAIFQVIYYQDQLQSSHHIKVQFQKIHSLESHKQAPS